MDHRLQRVQELFAEAVELEPEQRREFLTLACDGDDTLVEEVEALLRHDKESNDSLFISVSSQTEDALSGKPRRDSIGKYRVVRELGQGGMGTVYLATRDDDEYQKEVAIKLVPAVVDRDELMRRFKAERQIMASLEHPYIARLLDGETTRDGMPYVVMEFVDGVPIDRFVADQSLDINARLRLFQQVCDAVSYAHRNLIIHRDIKPSNILVCANGTPKLLDFGIAKILDTEDGPELTRSGMRLMTPEYASPEQARGEPVNTASDVYSLGVLLTKLLTGQMPYDLDTRELGGIEKIICEQAPVRPSTQNPEVTAELDDIVAMALRKEPDRRYASVTALSDDLGRYLSDRPVVARADTLRYRAYKFIRRNRFGVIAASSVVVALVAGIGVASVGMLRAQQAESKALNEAQVARNVTEAFVRMFTASDRYGLSSESVTVEALLDMGLADIRENIKDQPLVLGNLLMDVANIQQQADRTKSALELLDEAAAVYLSMDAPPAQQLFDNYRYAIRRADIVSDQSEVDARIERLVEWQQSAFPDSKLHLAQTLRERADIESARYDYNAAIELLTRELELRRSMNDTPEEIAILQRRIGYQHQWLDDAAGAVEYFELALEVLDVNPEEPDYGINYMLGQMAYAYSRLGQTDKTMQYAELQLAQAKRWWSETSPAYMDSVSVYANSLTLSDRIDEAVVVFRELIALNERLIEDGSATEDYTYAANIGDAAGTESKAGNYDRAEAMYLKELEVEMRLFGDDSVEHALTHFNLATNASLAGKKQKMLDHLAEAIRRNYPYDDIRGDGVFKAYANDLDFLAMVDRHNANLARLNP